MIFGKYINKYYLRYSWLLLIGVVALIMVDYFQLRIPQLYGLLIDCLDPNVADVTLTAETVTYIVTQMFIIIAFMVAGRFMWRWGFFGSAIRVVTDMRGEMFAHCKDLSQPFYQTNKVGNMMSLFTNDLDTINECFGDGTLMFFDATLMGTLAIYKMFTLHVVLTLLSLIPMVLLLICGVILSKYMTAKWENRQEAYSELSDFTQEYFSGIAVIKAFVKETLELLAFAKINKRNEDANVQFVKASMLMHVSITFFIQSVTAIIIGYGGWLAYKGVFNVSTLIMFISYFTSIVWPVMAVSFIIEQTSRGKASLKRISEFMQEKQTVVDKEGAVDIQSVRGDIEFRHLTFAYPDEPDVNVLEDVSFAIRAGENVGVIGRTGSGKSSVADLLLRVYNVEDGTLFVDGQDVNTITIRSLRNFYSYVPQDDFLFSESIEENISFAFGDSVVEHAEVQRAAMLADVHDNILIQPQQYETILGERGVTVSGGQKQRIAIARALMKNASILVMDDSLSAVDTKTEETILANLRQERKGKTTILIAHRISTVRNLDKIVLLDEGRVVDVGTHDELQQRCELYRNIVELQRLEEEEGTQQ